MCVAERDLDACGMSCILVEFEGRCLHSQIRSYPFEGAKRARGIVTRLDPEFVAYRPNEWKSPFQARMSIARTMTGQ